MSALTLSGFVIHRRPYRETSLLVDFFTLESGRITTVVKGVRSNSKSSRKSLLQPLQHVQFDCAGRSNLKSLIRIESLEPTLHCKGHALYATFYMNEILQRALPESEPVEQLFENYACTLQQLALLENQDKMMLEPLLRRFEFSLLITLGFLPDLTCESESDTPIERNAYYQYQPEVGLVRCNNTAKHAIAGSVLIKIAIGDFSAETLAPAKYLCRTTLPLAVGHKPIKSRELFV